MIALVSVHTDDGKRFGVYASSPDDILSSDFGTAKTESTSVLNLGDVSDGRWTATFAHIKQIITDMNDNHFSVPQGAWRDREAYKLRNGQYRPMPELDLELRYAHYVHLPESDTASLDSIAFTESEEKGQQNKQTV